MKRLLRWMVVLAVLAGGYYWLALDSRMPADADFPLDMTEVRRLADSLPGAKPAQVRFEKVMSYAFTHSMAVAGDDWSTVDVPVYAYQVVYPDGTVLIDAAMSRAMAKPEFMVPSYDDAAWQRVVAALDRAAQIVITHEHLDHLGGVMAHGNLASLLPRLRLTDLQLAHPERMRPYKPPAGAFDGYTPLRYERYHALAPGLVLVKAAGHTPGSQMVFVQLADGREILFLGDVVWKMRNLELQRERPRWITLLIQEDRHAVFGQIKALGELMQEEPGVKLVPGHDGPVVDALVAEGYLQAGFEM
jgi:glyoxylase-like metal-dependent hydrolase (beta-lactamase superfamily II)